MLTTSALLMGLSLLILLYACYLDRLLYLHSELRAAREGYRAIPAPAAGSSYPGAGYSYNSSSSSTGSRNIGEASTGPSTTSTTATSAA